MIAIIAPISKYHGQYYWTTNPMLIAPHPKVVLCSAS